VSVIDNVLPRRDKNKHVLGQVAAATCMTGWPLDGAATMALLELHAIGL